MILEQTTPIIPTPIITERDLQEEQKWYSLYNTTYEKDVSNLLSNFHTWSKDEILDWKKTVQLVQQLYSECELKDEDIYHLISRIECNNFGLWTRSQSNNCYGRSLYCHASYFNHSCSPNCEVHITGSFLSIYTLKKIEIGEELTIKYIDTNIPRSARNQKLQSDYRFSCECLRCNDEKEKIIKISYNSKSDKKKKNNDDNGTLIYLQEQKMLENLIIK